MSTQTTNLVSTDLDFIGFTYNGVHSSELGIIRTSNGDRYNTQLLPDMKDKTVEVPGRDGVFYFGSEYKQKPFEIPFATDSVTEEQYRKICQVFGDKDVHPLIFDEAPYKAYQAKCTASPQFNFICFEQSFEQDNKKVYKRVYKGEGTIKFVCYYPYAQSVYEFLDEYEGFEKIEESTDSESTDSISPFYRKKNDIIEDIQKLMLNNGFNYDAYQYLDYNSDGKINSQDIKILQKMPEDFIIPIEQTKIEGKTYYKLNNSGKNIFQWKEASGIRYRNDIVGESNNINNTSIIVYNPGEREIGCKIYFSGADIISKEYFFITAQEFTGSPPNNFRIALDFSQCKNEIDENNYICIDSINNLIYEVTSFSQNSNVEPQRTTKNFNKAIVAGDFFKIPQTEEMFIISWKGNGSGDFSPYKQGPNIARVDYKFLYY